MAVKDLRPVRILFVEDSMDDVKLALRALRRGGFAPSHARVQTAADFTAALSAHRWDAVISDYSMPGFTGLEALRIFQSTGIDIPFILVSGTIGEEFAAEAVKAGASDYVMKLNLARLAPALERELKDTQTRAAHSQAQRNLVESESRFRSLTALSSDWFWEQDAEFRFVTFSGGDQHGGWGSDQHGLAGLSRWELPGVKPVKTGWDEHKAVLAAHKPFRNFEYQRLMADGTLRYVAASGEPVFDADGRFTGYRGVATDITARKHAEHELQRFRAAMDISPDAIVLVDRASMRYIDVNQTTCDFSGLSRRDLLGMTPMDLTGQSREKLEHEYDALIADNDSAASWVEGQGLRKDGAPIVVETRRRALQTETGWIIVGTSRDITPRKEAENKIVRLNRVYAVLSGINGAIVRIKEPEALFREVCRIAVAEGRFSLARVIELDPEGRARIAATSEADASVFQQVLDEHNLDPVNSTSILGLILRSGEAVISNDVANDPRIPNRAALTKAGNYALALLPVRTGERLSGVIVLRAPRAGAFDRDELLLLHELTGNISFALDSFAKEEELNTMAAERMRGDETLRRFSAAMDATSDAIYLVDRASMNFVHVNEAACRMQGRTREELMAMGPEGVLSTPLAELEETYDAMIASGVPAEPFEMPRTRRDGSQVWVELRRHAQASAQGWTIVTLVRDITEQKARDADLQRFRAAMDVSGDAILLVDRESMRYIDVNRTLCELVGRTRQELIGMTPMDIFSADRATLERDYDALIENSNTSAALVDGEYRHKDGTLIPIEARRRALLSANGWVIVGTARDITGRKAAEARIAYLNRVYAMLSGINTLIVRVRDRDELLREACRIAVEEGGFRMAWLGIVDRTLMKIVPVASAGMTGEFLAGIKGLLLPSEDDPLGKSKAAWAIRQKKPVMSNDTQNDPAVVYGKKQDETQFRSMAIIPLIVADRAEGVLVLYAGEKEFFHAEEMKLLSELAGDIAFGIDHIAKQEKIDYLAYYDVLTGLANRGLFLERVAQFARAAAIGGHEMVVFLIDLERFKNINDSLGRPAGDELLRQAATWLKLNGGDASLIGRVGADQFAMVLPVVKPAGDIAHLLDKTIAAFMAHPFRLTDAVFRIAVKVGVAQFPGDGADAEALLRNAEVALKKAKARGERYVFYKQKMSEGGAGKLSLENKLRSALDKEEFVLHYQPKINLVSGKLTGAEALIRWNDPRTGLVPPGQFIPVLEETGMIHDVGRWALRKAIEDYLRWRAAGLPAVRLAVNVSPLQLRDRGFVAEVGHAIGIDPLAPEGLELEITESLIMEDVKHSIASLQAIREMKVTVAIDDFGTGFSSLSYLAKLPVDTLKIDRSFVVDMMAGPDGLSLVSTIISLAHALKLKVVAEGVETEEQSRLLRLLACDEMQGYLFSRPVAAGEFEARFLASAAVN